MKIQEAKWYGSQRNSIISDALSEADAMDLLQQINRINPEIKAIENTGSGYGDFYEIFIGNTDEFQRSFPKIRIIPISQRVPPQIAAENAANKEAEFRRIYDEIGMDEILKSLTPKRLAEIQKNKAASAISREKMEAMLGHKIKLPNLDELVKQGSRIKSPIAAPKIQGRISGGDKGSGPKR